MHPCPLVSVIVPVFNGAAFLAEALASVTAQQYREFDLIVVDDGSTDDSGAIARLCPGVRVLVQSNAGVAAARNAGVSAARGELVAFLDQDDRFTPDKLARQVAALAEAEAGYCLAHQRLFVEPGTPVPGWVRPEWLQGAQVGYLPGTLVVRQTVLARVGPFSSGGDVASDADWFLRTKDLGVGRLILPDVLLERRVHGGNLSRFTRDGNAQLLQAIRRSVARQHNPDKERP